MDNRPLVRSLWRGRASAFIVSAALGLALTGIAAVPALDAIAFADESGRQQGGLLGLLPQQQSQGSGSSSSSATGQCGQTAATNAGSSEADNSGGHQEQAALLNLYVQGQSGTSWSASAADAQQCRAHSDGSSTASASQAQSVALGLYHQQQGGSSQAISSTTATCTGRGASSSSTQVQSFTSTQQQGGVLGLAPQQQYLTQSSSSSSATTCAGSRNDTAGKTAGGQQQAGLLGLSYSNAESPAHSCLALKLDVLNVCLLGGQDQDSQARHQHQCAVGALYVGGPKGDWEACLVGAQQQVRGQISYQDSCLLLARQGPAGFSCAVGHQQQDASGGSAGQQQSGLAGSQQQGPAGQQQSGLLGLFHQQQGGPE